MCGCALEKVSGHGHVHTLLCVRAEQGAGCSQPVAAARSSSAASASLPRLA
jgi:hypothetical protein